MGLRELAGIPGVPLHAEDAGTGDAVLVLHGGFGTLEAMEPVVEPLRARFRIVGYERPGHGRSPDVDDEYDYARDVEIARAFLDETGARPAHVVGYSDGAVIALLLALSAPDRVRSLVLISGNLDPSAFADTPGVLPSLTPRPYDQDAPDLDRERYDRLSPDGPAHAETVLAKLARLWRTQPRIPPAALGAVRCPALVVSGDRDTVRPDHSLLVAASIQDAQLCIVPATTHDLIAERPGLVSRIIEEFLTSL